MTVHLASRTENLTRCYLTGKGTHHLGQVTCPQCKELSTQPEYAALDVFLKSLLRQTPSGVARSAINADRDPLTIGHPSAVRVGGAHLASAADGLGLLGNEAEADKSCCEPTAVESLTRPTAVDRPSTASEAA